MGGAGRDEKGEREVQRDVQAAGVDPIARGKHDTVETAR